MWEPRAVIVLILAASISLAHLIGITLAAWNGRTLNDAGGDVLVAILGAMIAIIAGYVGKQDNGGKRPDTRPEFPPDTGADRSAGEGLQSSARTEGQAGGERQSEGDAEIGSRQSKGRPSQEAAPEGRGDDEGQPRGGAEIKEPGVEK